MKTATSAICRTGAAAKHTNGVASQSEINLKGQESFVYVMMYHRDAAAGTPNINSCQFKLTRDEEGAGVHVTMDLGNGSGPFMTTASGATLSKPGLGTGDPLENAGDICLRVIYGDTRNFPFYAAAGVSGVPRFINLTSRITGTQELTFASCCLLFPTEFISNMRYIARLRTDEVMQGGDFNFTQIDEALNGEVSVLKADGNFYTGSNL